MKTSGQFDVKLAPQDTYATGQDGVNLGKLSIDKIFSGGLEATSQGEMLSAMTPEKGSAGYVATEQVIGTLDDRKGSFVFQHFGIMDKGQDRLILEVVPDSGSGELAGLTGTMKIKIDNGQHFYELDYHLD